MFDYEGHWSTTIHLLHASGIHPAETHPFVSCCSQESRVAAAMRLLRAHSTSRLISLAPAALDCLEHGEPAGEGYITVGTSRGKCSDTLMWSYLPNGHPQGVKMFQNDIFGE